MDGSLVDSSTDRGSFNGMNENSDPFFIGARVNDNGTGHLLWDDKIDEVSILNDELSSEEVVSLYNSGNPKSPNNVIAYYNMERRGQHIGRSKLKTQTMEQLLEQLIFR